ncbi:hypothetical protein PENTCL1PPCAC_8470, partial [Pristionchus entomophagus]
VARLIDSIRATATSCCTFRCDHYRILEDPRLYMLAHLLYLIARCRQFETDEQQSDHSLNRTVFSIRHMHCSC